MAELLVLSYPGHRSSQTFDTEGELRYRPRLRPLSEDPLRTALALPPRRTALANQLIASLDEVDEEAERACILTPAAATAIRAVRPNT